VNARDIMSDLSQTGVFIARGPGAGIRRRRPHRRPGAVHFEPSSGWQLGSGMRRRGLRALVTIVEVADEQERLRL
jgi:hypothetical protein